MKDPGIYELIYEITRHIPRGKVTSYGAIAKCIGSGRSARMVGWALAVTPPDSGIPAHRVVNRNGLLTGKHHFSTPTQMQELLEAEGIDIKDDQVQHFEALFWDPARHFL